MATTTSLLCSPRRGKWHEKIQPAHLDFLTDALGTSPGTTLKEMAAALLKEYDVQITPQAVKKRIDGLGFTLKKPHDKPQHMNIPKNKQKRYEYLCKIYEYQTAGRSVYYMDETNINLWTARTRARSKKGERAPRKKVSGGEQNMHVIPCIDLSGLVYYETQFGANNAVNIKEFTRATLRSIRLLCPLHEVLLVSDNAPCHTNIEEVLAEEELAGAAFLCLGPYSPMLNPIENVLSSTRTI